MGNSTKKLAEGSKMLQSVGRAGKSSGESFGAFQKKARKLNNTFTNLNRDGNRTTKVFKGMGSSLFSLGNIIKGVGLWKLSGFLSQAVTSAMDMIETTHLFEVSMGNLAEETDVVIQKMHELTGLDVANLRNRIGTMNLLGQTMGMTAKNAQTLALNTNQLSLDMGALFNVPYQQITEDLRSGLIGQSRTLYKYGIDVTEAAIANEALAQGITKSVRHMSQGEKMMLRHNIIVRQMSKMQGDFAITFNQPINQLRVLQERFVTLSRTIGQLFVPVMSVVLKVANAVTIALTRMVTFLGGLLGIDMSSKVNNIADSFAGINENIDDGMDSLGGGLGSANKQAKKLKKQLAGFDELNIIQTKIPDSASGGSGGGADGGVGGGSPLDLDLGLYDAMIEGIEDKAKTMADSMTKWLKAVWEEADPTREALVRLWNEGLSKFANFSMGALLDFYNSFLVPVGEWTLGEGLPRFIDAINYGLMSIDWENINESLKNLWDKLSDFGILSLDVFVEVWEKHIVPMFAEKLDKTVPLMLDILGEAIEVLGMAIDIARPALSWFLDNILPIITSAKLGVTLALLETIKQFLEDIKETLQKVADIKEEMGGGPLAWLEMGAELIAGLVEGLVEGVFNLVENMYEFVIKPIIDKVKELFGIKSPSTVFADIGKDIIAGLLKGMLGSWAAIPKKIGEKIDNLKKIVAKKWVEVTDNVKGKVVEFKGKVATKWNDIRKKWTDITDNIKDKTADFKAKVATKWSELKSTWDSLTSNVKDKVADFKGRVVTKWSDIKYSWDNLTKNIKNKTADFKGRVATTWSSIQTSWNNLTKNIKDKTVNFRGRVATTWSSLRTTWTNLTNNFKDKTVAFRVRLSTTVGSVKNFVNQLISSINRNLIAKLDFSFRVPSWLGGGRWTWKAPRIPMLADGGMLNAGQMFIAREAGPELVGSYGSKTAVMNNDDIVASVSRGVYQAVKSAMGSIGGNDSPTHIIVKVGEDTLVDRIISGTNRKSLIDGRTVINV